MGFNSGFKGLKKNTLHEDYVRPFVRLFVSQIVPETKFLEDFHEIRNRVFFFFFAKHQQS